MQEMILLNPGRKKRRVTKKRKTTAKAKKRKVKRRAKPAAKRTTRKRTTRRAAPKRKVSTMARKKRTYKRKTRARKNPTRRRRVRRNPSRARRVYSRARSTFSGLNIKQALKDQIPMIVGMMGAKWAAKRFGEAASETDPESWNYMSYIKAGLGAVGTAVIAQNLKPGSGQKVLTGGLAYVGFKLIQNEFIVKSEWATEQFGAEEYYPSEYLEGTDYQPGVIEYNEAGTPYMLGEDGQWHDMSGQAALAPVGRLGADYPAPMQPVDQLGASPGSDAAYREALLS